MIFLQNHQALLNGSKIILDLNTKFIFFAKEKLKKNEFPNLTKTYHEDNLFKRSYYGRT